MSSATSNGSMQVSAHCIERLAQEITREDKHRLCDFLIFKNESIAPKYIVRICAFERALRRYFEEDKPEGALDCFKKNLERRYSLRQGSVELLIRGLISSRLAVRLTIKEELFVKSSKTSRPRPEEDGYYVRFKDFVFVVSHDVVKTCFALDIYQIDVLDCFHESKTIETF